MAKVTSPLDTMAKLTYHSAMMSTLSQQPFPDALVWALTPAGVLVRSVAGWRVADVCAEREPERDAEPLYEPVAPRKRVLKAAA